HAVELLAVDLERDVVAVGDHLQHEPGFHRERLHLVVNNLSRGAPLAGAVAVERWGRVARGEVSFVAAFTTENVVPQQQTGDGAPVQLQFGPEVEVREIGPHRAQLAEMNRPAADQDAVFDTPRGLLRRRLLPRGQVAAVEKRDPAGVSRQFIEYALKY